MGLLNRYIHDTFTTVTIPATLGAVLTEALTKRRANANAILSPLSSYQHQHHQHQPPPAQQPNLNPNPKSDLGPHLDLAWLQDLDKRAAAPPIFNFSIWFRRFGFAREGHLLRQEPRHRSPTKPSNKFEERCETKPFAKLVYTSSHLVRLMAAATPPYNVSFEPARLAETSMPIPIEHSEVMVDEQPTKLKGRTRLLQGLQRISSSPSLVQLGRKRATSNPYGGRSSLSCVSLASGSSPRNYDSPYSPQPLGEEQSSAPTPYQSTYGLDTPFIDGSYVEPAIRRREQGYFTPGTSVPTSPLPPDVRPHSRGALLPFPPYSSVAEIPKGVSLATAPPKRARRVKVDFWKEMPHEIKVAIFAYLTPKQLVRISVVSKDFHKMCFDGQLWTCFDASEFYKDIPAESLAKIIVAAGFFVKDLNLRGCVQVEHYKRAEVIVKACRNLINATLEGCRNFKRHALHNLLESNGRLANLNLTGLTAVTNGTCKIIAQSCPSLEVFNVSWCTRMDARGIRTVIQGCRLLKDLRAGEVKGFDNLDLAQDIFETNRLEKLVLSGCTDVNDKALQTMVAGRDPEIDILTDRPVVPVRNLRHLDLSRCSHLTSAGVKALAHLVPELRGLQLSGCSLLTDDALSDILATAPHLTHLDLEEIPELTNTLLSQDLAKCPCAPKLKHLSVSYCENIGDVGMIPVVRACTALQSIDMDNTKVSDLVLAEAAAMVRARSSRTTSPESLPRVGLRMVVFDCANVTWTGTREVLSCNSEVKKPSGTQNGAVTYPTEIISLKCFYGWQMTVDEHTKRVLRGDFSAAGRLERKWTEYQMANEEAGAGGAGARRRRRRAREAQMLHADEEEGGVGMGGIGRRRRARSNGCSVM
ncbi:uncharacterized protein BP5553_00578 [Venustampulla echinocandica]|uniref:F-box domain-containing protein n=1 Tax=Venustampulla echinocandica TaxID=2656787 RepID=A0A370TYK1_9HELO|nr:uncharacterized protein BP5553_00578 [Venustampulla echinocandica]RDL40599.1 hypothetical protein BP5553_00578 [Venustampulla echinocandica]